jgi:hypothetical protein
MFYEQTVVVLRTCERQGCVASIIARETDPYPDVVAPVGCHLGQVNIVHVSAPVGVPVHQK